MDKLKLAAVKLDGETECGSGSICIFYRWPCIATNNHVCPNFEAAIDLDVELKDHDGNIVTCMLNPAVFFVTNADLDFTICALAWWPKMKNGRVFPGAWDFLQIIQNPLNEVVVNTIISLWQHPEGGDKHIATGLVKRVNSDYISYEADTFGGTSGSLVTVAGKPLAIHVGRLNGKEGNFGLKLSSVLEVLQRTPRRKELTSSQAFTWVEKADIKCK